MESCTGVVDLSSVSLHANSMQPALVDSYLVKRFWARKEFLDESNGAA